MDKEKKYLRDEIRKEFQLERMILFSDAVFAIVMTLMAIEIRIPESSPVNSETIPKLLVHLIPVFVAYAVTFFFIGSTWYEHLRVFSLLKDYDKGLVVRNLVMLFFIGLFPFSVTLIAHPNNTIFLPLTIYFSVIIICKSAQLVLQHYILVKRPELRINADIHDALMRFKKTRFIIILLAVLFLVISVTSYLIKDPGLKHAVWCWFIPFPFLLKYYERRLAKKYPASH